MAVIENPGASVKPSRLFFPLIAAIVLIPAAFADSIDMDDPRRTVGREDNVRVDAQLVQDTVSPGSPIGITYQIENFSSAPVAWRTKCRKPRTDRIRDHHGPMGRKFQRRKMPHVVTVAPGEKKVFRTAVPFPRRAASRFRLRLRVRADQGPDSRNLARSPS